MQFALKNPIKTYFEDGAEDANYKINIKKGKWKTSREPDSNQRPNDDSLDPTTVLHSTSWGIVGLMIISRIFW